MRRGLLAVASVALLSVAALVWLATRPAGPSLAGDLRSLVWYSPSGEPLAAVPGPDAPYTDVWFGPDESTAYAVLGGTLWRIDLASGAMEPEVAGAPGDLPAGATLRHAAGDWLVYDVLAGGPGDGPPAIWIAARDGSRAATPFPSMPWPLGDGRLSNDQRWMAYASGESGPREIYVTTVPDGESRWLISLPDGGRRPVWRSDSQAIYYWAPGGRLMVANLRRGDRLVEPSLPRLVFERPGLADAPFAVTRDASRILIAVTHD